MKKHLLISVLVFILAGGGHNMPVRADEAADSVRYAVSLLTGSYGRIDTLKPCSCCSSGLPVTTRKP